MFNDVREKLARFFGDLFNGERKQNLQELIELSQRWQPSPGNDDYSFHDEMQNRMLYLVGSMQADMQDVLEKQFPQMHDYIRKEQVNLPLVKNEFEQRARVFVNAGQLYLRDSNGDRVDSPEFDQFIKDSRLWSSFKQVDRYTQILQRAMFKPWWDRRQNRVRISIWPQHQCFIVPNTENAWFSVDDAFAVLFQLPGVDGLASTYPRYEVWGYRTEAAADSTGNDTIHFVTDGQMDYKINEDDINPFIDPRTGDPMYPFVWWQADDSSTDLYSLGDEDTLTVNRTLNLGLTHLQYAIKMKSYGVWAHTKAENGTDLGVQVMFPNTIADLVAGARLENIATNLPINDVWNYYKELIGQASLLRGLPSYAVRADSGGPESGYALKVRSRPLTEHRENMIEIYRPYVIESVFRAAVVHNTYADYQVPLDL